MNKYTIVIPCYNEARSLPELIQQLGKLNKIFNFILVDNGSTDNTQKTLNLSQLPENIALLKKEKNTGYGAGIKFGLKKVETEFCGWMHADLQQNALILLKAKKVFETYFHKKGQDLLAVKGLRSGRTLFENFFTIGVSFIASALFFRKFWDIAGQPHIFKTSSLKFLKNAPDDHNFEFFVYIYFSIVLNGKFKRFEAPLKKRKFGESSWDKGILSKLKHSKKIFKYILHLRFNSSF